MLNNSKTTRSNFDFHGKLCAKYLIYSRKGGLSFEKQKFVSKQDTVWVIQTVSRIWKWDL